ncbi:MAG: hypothetical protein K2Y27_17460 [Xanthobacteraceae bacterium]|nr:hypothetical protein [Xanthobacteraceae bacterium]
MDFRAIRRAVVALTAAYSMALQALLLAFVVPQVAALADPLTVLCSTIGFGDSGPPAQHEIPCPAVCAAMGHGLTGALPAGIAAVALLREAHAAVVSLAGWIVPLVFAAGPQPPRGPPAA